ncbi:uncharacterized protein DUF559 [Sporomusa sp. KB1]|nr:uncharacterized protein DUF559 [Sporomusa sp. KB1]
MEEELARDRAIRLFTFLRQLSELRTKTVRSLESYENVLWLSEIPKTKGCFFYAWTNEANPNKDSWIEIDKPYIIPAPLVPPEVQPWVISGQISDSSIECPKLATTRVVEIVEEPETEGEESGKKSVILSLEDYPEIQKSWDVYLKNQWMPWANEDRILQQTQKVYSELYSMYQYQQRMGESYEVVLCTGYLTWKTMHGQFIRRHILSSQALIGFDPGKGRISIGASVEGAKTALEQDMLEPEERPDSNEIQVIERSVNDLGDDITNKSAVDNILRSWINTIPNSLGYNDEISFSKNIEDAAKITFAPALVLRRRTERSLVRAFKEITEQLKETGVVPKGLHSLVYDPEREQLQSGSDEHDRIELDMGLGEKGDNLVYFPLLANDEQIEIAKQIKYQQGVLVQGPPGTGKSHTISNLICHLLASGQKVLVTSHTSRALTVLRDKIPAEIAPLCVVALSDDAKSLKALETSVNGITEKYNIWNPTLNQKEIDRLYQELDVCRIAENKASAEFRIIRESETLRHISKFGCYDGSLKTIAQQIKATEDLYSWLADNVDEENEPPLSDTEMSELLELVRSITSEQETEANNFVPEISKLPSVHEMRILFQNERLAKDRFAGFQRVKHSAEYEQISKSDVDKRARLQKALLDLNSKSIALSENIYPWAKEVVQQVLAGITFPPQELQRISSLHLKGIEASIGEVGALNVTGIDGYDKSTIKIHAKALLNHLENGGSLGWWKLRPRVVSDALYIIEEIRVDGHPCSSVTVLRKLIDWLIMNEHFVSLENTWASRDENIGSAVFTVRKAEFDGKLASLERCLSLENELLAAKDAVCRIEGLFQPIWHNRSQVEMLTEAVAAVDACQELLDTTNKIETILQTLQQQIDNNKDIHPLVIELHGAVKTRNSEAYCLLLQQFQELSALKNSVNRRRQLISRLRERAYSLAEAIQQDPNNKQWDIRLENFTAAWNWVRADRWLKQVSDPVQHEQLELQIDQLRKKSQQIVAELAAAKAWRSCLSRLTDYENGHLKAWQMAMGRLGKGNSVRANEYRREARKHMEECRSAIPAWIMPIYRVAETIEMKPSIFDVVIVDEASQSGPEALFLQYIAKKIVVVGDNKQISPQFVGLNKDDVALLRQRLISDIPFSDALGIEHSFFDHAFIRYTGQICLREHFRCMPEIIQFSNNLCYSSTPLIPLKQFGGSRLSPTVGTRYISEGYQKGRSPRITNPPEAQAIAGFLAECCRKKEYEGKTFGVISLLGEEQAKIIYSLLIQLIGPSEMEQRGLICGDAYAFQGDERDVIVLSMVSAPGEDHRIGTLAKADDEKRFNVAASRAKEQMILFHSATLDDLSSQCLRSKLLKYCLDPKVEPVGVEEHNINSLRLLADSANRSQVNPPHPFDSWFELDIFLEIVSRGYRVIPQHEVAGYRIDLIVEGMRGRLAVECDGDYWHGPEQYDRDMVRQRQLERSGYIFWRIRESTYYRNSEVAMKSLWTTLESMGIYPGEQVTINVGKSDSSCSDKTSNEQDTNVNNTDNNLTADHSSIKGAERQVLGKTAEKFQEELTEQIREAKATESLLPIDGSSTTGLETPYNNWPAHSVPDPRTAPEANVLNALIEIIKAEGPIIGHRVYRIYLNACGIHRTGRQLRFVFNKIVTKAVREKLILETNEYKLQDQIHKILRTPDSPPVVVRNRGNRTLEEIPPAEIAEVMRLLTESQSELKNDKEKLFRSVLDNYDLVRMTTNAKDILEKALGMG